jgi:hypothetical protein
MNEFPGKKLGEVVKSLGLTSERLNTDTKLIKALLLDLCGQHRREINVLVLAFAEGFVEKLAKSKDGSPQMRVATAARRFCEEFALTEEAASWGINSWAIALGIIDRPVPVIAPSLPGTQQSITITPPKLNIPPVSSANVPGLPQIVDPSKPVAVVSRLGFGQYKTIGDAIKAVDSNSMIVVKQGTYEESIWSSKCLHIHADESGGPVVLKNRDSVRFGTSLSVILSGFTVPDQVTIDSGRVHFVKCALGEIKFTTSILNKAHDIYFHDCLVRSIEIPSQDSIIPVERQLTMERCQIYNHDVCVSVSGKTASAKLLDCKLHTCKRAVVFNGESKGLFSDCEIYKCTSAAVEIDKDSSVSFENCRMHDNSSGVVLVKGYGLAKFENCQIYNNEGVAFSVQSGNIELHRCLVNGNLKAASFEAESAGTVTECDLRNNKLPFTIVPGAQVHQSNNIN